MTPSFERLRELAARRICEIRGQDPDEIQKQGTGRPLWEAVATVVIDPALRFEAVEAIAWAREQMQREAGDAVVQSPE